MKKAKKIMTQCGQKNSCESVDINLHNAVWSNVTGKSSTPDISFEKCFGDPQPVTTLVGSGLIVPSHDPKLLKRVVQYLGDASVILRANNNQFLADSAIELAAQIKSQFGIC
jgi:hypothetical protein